MKKKETFSLSVLEVFKKNEKTFKDDYRSVDG
jgi:hypothetical protein